MTEVTFEITRMWPRRDLLEGGTEIVAIFEVDVFPFRIRQGKIRRGSSGSLWATLPGRRSGGIAITSPELVAAICEEALELYAKEFGQ
jgi:hypothetical protein